MKQPLAVLGFLILFAAVSVRPGYADEQLAEAEAKFRQGKFAEAVKLVTLVIENSGNQLDALRLRSACFEGLRQFDKAIRDLDQCIKLKPEMSSLCQRRGELHFRNGAIDESIRDFDHFLRENPDQDPYHWQRGISYYYAAQYAKGAAQFERHKAVNPQDVENSVWHFLCKSRIVGVEKARESLIEIERDRRPWAMVVYQLFQGKATPEEVIKHAEQTNPKLLRDDSLFYAHLYVGLHYESLKQEEKALSHIKLAVEKYPSPHYMGDVARVHLRLRKQVAEN